ASGSRTRVARARSSPSARCAISPTQVITALESPTLHGHLDARSCSRAVSSSRAFASSVFQRHDRLRPGPLRRLEPRLNSRSQLVANPSLAEIVIVSGARTPMAEWIGGKRGAGLPGGALASASAIDLGAVAACAAIERAGITPDAIDHVVMGNAMQTSGDALYGARHVALRAGIPRPVPALTVNRLCGSGLQSVVNAVQQIQTGESTWVLAGGMENMSQAPHVIRGARGGLRLGQGQLEDSLMAGLKDSYCGLFMAQTSDLLARKYGITREQQ